jgi:hypothetical protein
MKTSKVSELHILKIMEFRKCIMTISYLHKSEVWQGSQFGRSSYNRRVPHTPEKDRLSRTLN